MSNGAARLAWPSSLGPMRRASIDLHVPNRQAVACCDGLAQKVCARQSLQRSLVDIGLGCTVVPDPANDHAATLTLGATAGTIIVETSDSNGTNRARVPIVIP